MISVLFWLCPFKCNALEQRLFLLFFFSLSVQSVVQEVSVLVETSGIARIVIMESLFPVSQALNELIEKCQY